MFGHSSRDITDFLFGFFHQSVVCFRALGERRSLLRPVIFERIIDHCISRVLALTCTVVKIVQCQVVHFNTTLMKLAWFVQGDPKAKSHFHMKNLIIYTKTEK